MRWAGEAAGIRCCKQKDSRQEDSGAGACLPGHWAAFAAGAENKNGDESRGITMRGKLREWNFVLKAPGK